MDRAESGVRVNLRSVALCLALLWPATAAVPTPESHFGHKIGADRILLDWDKVVSYFRVVEKNSDRLRVEELGKTVEGRPFIAVTIAEPDTLRNLDRYREIQQRLADPRITTEPEAEDLIARGKTVVLLTCSIHSTEVASTHSAVEFAYRLLTEDKPRYRAILHDTILVLVPSLNPDGVDIVTRWYRRTLGTAYEGASPPELYHRYLGHDNNRDWYIFSQPETRLTVGKLHNAWHPQIVYDVHQQGQYASRLFVPPWLDPIEPNVDAILAQEMNMIGTAMASDLTAAGKKGIAIHGAYDFWSPARHYQAFHAGLRILTESASARLATPVTIRRDQLEKNALGYSAQDRSWNFLEPWEGGDWRLRDIIDYQLVAFESCLYQAAIHREELLRNFYRVGRRAIERTTPAAFFIPAKQRDPGATRRLLETLDFGMVEIGRAQDGAHVISMAQPYSSFAKALLERQNYPDMRQAPGGQPVRPYDVTAHTLPLLMGVDVETLERPFAGALVREHCPALEAPESFSASDTDSWLTINRVWKSGGAVWRDPASGDFATTPKGAGWKQLRRPRIGVYKSFVPSMDEGWTRWLLEQFGFDYTSVGNPRLQSGHLRGAFDVLVFPDQPVNDLVNGYAKGAMPDEFTGGLGDAGASALREFASDGGTIVFFNRSTAYAVQRLGIKARNVVEGVSNSDFYSPGSLLHVELNTRHPLALGLPREIAVWSEQSPAWDAAEPVARYPDSQILASGWLMGEKFLAGRAALLDVPLGAGHVLLFGMRPQYRGQSYQTFKLFFNSLIY